ncbi:hypothetical protein E8E13_009540 [Curvularia kusanoi]|uniref:Uncharacterized protein n=1 Tax=Curvularia kusanoi TaxID=90978 RepID=A0A9P4TH81_CURKU|nr:hypothetical protein E8E13_009540 [Curvularia kusanoi]
MSLHTRQPTLLRMVMDPSSTSVPTTPMQTSETSISEGTSPNRTELEPTPLLLALDMQAERNRLRSRKDSVVTGAGTGVEKANDEAETTKVECIEGKDMEGREEGDGKEVIIPVKDDLSQLALLGQAVGNGFWNGIEGVRKSVWGLAGWA